MEGAKSLNLTGRLSFYEEGEGGGRRKKEKKFEEGKGDKLRKCPIKLGL